MMYRRPDLLTILLSCHGFFQVWKHPHCPEKSCKFSIQDALISSFWRDEQHICQFQEPEREKLKRTLGYVYYQHNVIVPMLFRGRNVKNILLISWWSLQGFQASLCTHGDTYPLEVPRDSWTNYYQFHELSGTSENGFADLHPIACINSAPQAWVQQH